jgi:hypothetical protein
LANEIFKQRLVDAGRIAPSKTTLGGRGLLPDGRAVCGWTVSRFGSPQQTSGATVRRALLTFVLTLLLAGVLAATAGAQATVAGASDAAATDPTAPAMSAVDDTTPATDPVTDPVVADTTPVADPTPVTDPVPAADPTATTPTATDPAPLSDPVVAGPVDPTPLLALIHISEPTRHLSSA